MSQYDPLDLRGQERAKHLSDEDARRAAEQEIEDWKWLLADKRGRRIAYRLLDRAGIFRSSFTGNSETFFREGQRNVGLMIMAQVHEAAPEKYAQMMREAKA